MMKQPAALLLRAIQPSRSQFRLLICLVCLSIALPIAGLAQTNVPAPLPPAAQEAFDKGIIAAKEGGYVLAIRYLQYARKLAPQAPQIFRSLGAVEAKIPGRELRAIAWYGAYLAAIPNASDAAEVKKEILRLEIKSQINTLGLIKSVENAASQISDGKDANLRYVFEKNKAGVEQLFLKTGMYNRNKRLCGVAELWAEGGDTAAALKTADLIQNKSDKSRAQKAITEAQLKADDIAGAQKTADGIQDTSEKSSAQRDIAKAKAQTGDFAGALKTADLIQSGGYAKDGAHLDIAGVQAGVGDIAGAQITADVIQEPSFKNSAQEAIAKAQIKAGDIAGALKTADLIQSGDSPRGIVLSAIAKAQLKSGDIAGALKTADIIQDSTLKRFAQLDIAEAQTKAVIIAPPNSTRQATSDTQPPIQPAITVSDWLKKLDDGVNSSDCPLNTEPFLELAAYLKSLPPSDNPQKVFESLHETAKKIVRAQSVIAGMLKQQAGRQ